MLHKYHIIIRIRGDLRAYLEYPYLTTGATEAQSSEATLPKVTQPASNRALNLGHQHLISFLHSKSGQQNSGIMELRRYP